MGMARGPVLLCGRGQDDGADAVGNATPATGHIIARMRGRHSCKTSGGPTTDDDDDAPWRLCTCTGGHAHHRNVKAEKLLMVTASTTAFGHVWGLVVFAT